MSGDVLYDMRTAAPGLSPLLGGLLVVVALGVLFGKPAGASHDPALQRVIAVVAAVGGLAALAASLAPFALRPWAQWQIASGRASEAQGCVTRFERVVHPRRHSIADTWFSVGGQDFHFNSSRWMPGYRNADDEIRPGDGLRILRSGTIVLRIVRAPEACPA